MGVYIKGAEMPKTCAGCFVNCNLRQYSWSIYSRPDNCPLVPVPPHGRLIDADALLDDFRKTIEECKKWEKDAKDSLTKTKAEHAQQDFIEAVLRLKAAPTIIPAEEG